MLFVFRILKNIFPTAFKIFSLNLTPFLLLGALFAFISFLHLALGQLFDVLKGVWIIQIGSLGLTSLFSMLTFAVWAGGVSGDIPGHYGPSFALFVITFPTTLIWMLYVFLVALIGPDYD